MMQKLLFMLMAIGGVLLLIVLRGVRHAHIRVEHSVSWLAAAVFLILMSSSLTLRTWFAHILGVPQEPIILLFLAAVVFLAVFYRYTRVVSELKDMNITLTQRVAILEYQLHRKNETVQKNS